MLANNCMAKELYELSEEDEKADWKRNYAESVKHNWLYKNMHKFMKFYLRIHTNQYLSMYSYATKYDL